jgi:diguanylate cyclase
VAGPRTHRLPRALSWLPAGHPLPADVWIARHQLVVGILLVQVPALAAFGLFRGYSASHALPEALVPAAMAALACWPRLSPMVRSCLAASGLMVVSGLLVHLSGGTTEAHFHFFVMIPVAALYQSWAPFGLAIWFVLFQHGIIGTLSSHSVYDNPAAQAHPWTWAAIHAGAFAAACLGAMMNWKFHERSRAAETALSAQLAHRVLHDDLTGLPSRALFQERLDLALEKTAQGLVPTVLILDLDGFKEVNDTFGHHYGDLVLVEVANRLSGCVQSDDTVSRLGGDEFAVLLAASHDPERGERCAARIAAALATPLNSQYVDVHLEVSMGIATADSADTSETLLRHADAAMYVAKEQRSGCARYGPESDQTVISRLQLLGELRRALSADEISVLYQPQVALGTGDVVGVEALARWQHPTRGLLDPIEFVGVIDRTTLSLEFTDRVLATAVDQLRDWLDQGLHLPTSVNVSPRCLLDAELPDRIEQKLVSAGVPGELLCLEVTEDTVIANHDRAVDILRRIRMLGVRISVDDFGTGYSSMTYLKTLPVDEVKVDKSFVSDMVGGDHRDIAMVRSVINLAHELGLSVVAEGVETAAAAEVLRDLDCDVVQGYHFARPMTPAQLGAMLADGRDGALRVGASAES